MRAVIQRVSRAAVRVDGDVAGEIGAGLLVLLGVGRGRRGERRRAARREGRAAADLRRTTTAASTAPSSTPAAPLLVVSQFTLIADTAKGNRPSFAGAAAPEDAERLYERFCAALRDLGVAVEQGVFGARMDVELVNDGPVTIVLP